MSTADEAVADDIVRAMGLPRDHVVTSLAKAHHAPHAPSPLSSFTRQETHVTDYRLDTAELTATHWVHVDGLDDPVEALVTIRVEAALHAAVLVTAAAAATDTALRFTTDHPDAPPTLGETQPVMGWRRGAHTLRDSHHLLWTLHEDGTWRSPGHDSYHSLSDLQTRGTLTVDLSS